MLYSDESLGARDQITVFHGHVNSEVGISVQLWAANDKGVCVGIREKERKHEAARTLLSLWKLTAVLAESSVTVPVETPQNRCSRSVMHCGSLYNTSWRTHSAPWYLAVPQHFSHSCPPPSLFTVSLDRWVPTGPVWLIAWSNSLLCLSSGEAGLKRTH